jgi:hypothetical protein
MPPKPKPWLFLLREILFPICNCSLTISLLRGFPLSNSLESGLLRTSPGLYTLIIYAKRPVVL